MPADLPSSLFDVGDGNVLGNAVDWMSGVLVGSVGTGLTILAVAVIGLLMLTGRLAVREGARVVLGCAILFGAPTVAMVLRDLADKDRSSISMGSPGVKLRLPARPDLQASNYDPYAGASLRNDGP